MKGKAVVLSLAAMIGADAVGAEPVREDFAYEVPIVAQETAAVYRIPLIADVYRIATRADLADIRVFNAAGEAVPHGLNRATAEPVKRMAALPLFPIVVRDTSANADVSLQIERNRDGSIAGIRTRRAAVAGRTIYVVDASRIEDALVALEVEWKAADASGFIASLSIEASTDLKSWRAIGQGAVASLSREGETLEQKRIALPAQRAKYLRLSWSDPAIDARITSVKAELQDAVEIRRDWMALAGEPGDKAGEYRFTLAGQMPVDRVRVLLPPNSVARVEMLSRAKDGDAWSARGEKTVYVLVDKRGDLKDNEILLNPGGGARQWLLRLQRQAAGAAPGLEVGWIPHELVFVARGKAPFALAYGRIGTQPLDYGIDELVRRSKRDDAERVDIRAAAFGAPYAQRGNAALSLPWYRGNWKQWLLWAVLVLGVAALGGVAWRLAKHAQTESGGEN